MAIPANRPCSFDPFATFIITSIKKNVSINSNTKDCILLPAGMVAPNKTEAGKRSFNTTLAVSAPASWLII